jgi:hypothetical protein
MHDTQSQTHRTGRIPGGSLALAHRRRRAAWAGRAAGNTDSNCDPGFGVAVPDCGDHAFGTPVAANDPGFYADRGAYGAPLDDGHAEHPDANCYTVSRLDTDRCCSDPGDCADIGCGSAGPANRP